MLKNGFRINNPLNKDTGFFTLDALEVPFKDVDNVIDRINYVKDEIKKMQIEHYDGDENKLSLDNPHTSLEFKYICSSLNRLIPRV